MGKTQNKKQNETSRTNPEYQKSGEQISRNPNAAGTAAPVTVQAQKKKERKNVKEAPSKEDWEGGGSRPAEEDQPEYWGEQAEQEREYPRPLEAGQKKQPKELKRDNENQDWQRRKAV